MDLLLHTGRCYKAGICAILLPLRCSFLMVRQVVFKLFFPRKGPWFEFWGSKKSLEIRILSERASQEGQNGASVSFVAPSREDF